MYYLSILATYLKQRGEQVKQDEGHGEDDLCLGHQDCQVEHKMSYNKNWDIQ